MGIRPWATSTHRLAALNLKIEQLEAELTALCIERDALLWALEEGDHTE